MNFGDFCFTQFLTNSQIIYLSSLYLPIIFLPTHLCISYNSENELMICISTQERLSILRINEVNNALTTYMITWLSSIFHKTTYGSISLIFFFFLLHYSHNSRARYCRLHFHGEFLCACVTTLAESARWGAIPKLEVANHTWQMSEIYAPKPKAKDSPTQCSFRDAFKSVHT